MATFRPVGHGEPHSDPGCHRRFRGRRTAASAESEAAVGRPLIHFEEYCDNLISLKWKYEDSPNAQRKRVYLKNDNHHGTGLNYARIAAFELGVKGFSPAIDIAFAPIGGTHEPVGSHNLEVRSRCSKECSEEDGGAGRFREGLVDQGGSVTDAMRGMLSGLMWISALFPFAVYKVMERSVQDRALFCQFQTDTLSLGNSGHEIEIDARSEQQAQKVLQLS